jgi:hypothetical protein
MFATGLIFSLTNALFVPFCVPKSSPRATLLGGLFLLAFARFVQAAAVTLPLAALGTALAAVGETCVSLRSTVV